MNAGAPIRVRGTRTVAWWPSDTPGSGTALDLIAPGYAADLNLLDPTDWTVQHVWCAGRQVK